MFKIAGLLVFATIFFNQSVGEVCVDKVALTNIKAFVHKKWNTRGEYFEGSFYDLEQNYGLIQVTKANVTHLCPAMVKNFYRLEFLSLINVNLSKMEPGSLENLPKLKQISLSVNHLTRIDNGIFNAVKSLQTIYLSHNEIEFIADGAFSEMLYLKAVHLDHNKLAQISGNIFFGDKKITLLDFSFNQIVRIDDKSFDDLKPEVASKKVNIYLKKNQIEFVSSSALEKLGNPLNFHLEGNKIVTFSEIIFSVKENSEVYLDDNEIEWITDDVLDEIMSIKKKVQIKNNPIDCKCLDRVDKYLKYGEVKGELIFESKFPCRAFSNFI